MSFGLGCVWNSQDVRLTIHYENGFTVSSEGAGSTGILLRYPFEKLKMSADDGVRNLYLDFGGPEGELVSGWLRPVGGEPSSGDVCLKRDCGVRQVPAIPLENKGGRPFALPPEGEGDGHRNGALKMAATHNQKAT